MVFIDTHAGMAGGIAKLTRKRGDSVESSLRSVKGEGERRRAKDKGSDKEKEKEKEREKDKDKDEVSPFSPLSTSVVGSPPSTTPSSPYTLSASASMYGDSASHGPVFFPSSPPRSESTSTASEETTEDLELPLNDSQNEREFCLSFLKGKSSGDSAVFLEWVESVFLSAKITVDSNMQGMRSISSP